MADDLPAPRPPLSVTLCLSDEQLRPATIDEAIGLAGVLGAGGLELTLAHERVLSSETPLERCDEWARRAEDARVRLAVVRGLFPPGCDFGRVEAERRAQARAWVCSALERAERLGAECLHVAPACLTAAEAPGEPFEIDYADALNRTYECLSELWPAAERRGVALAVLPAAGGFLLSPVEACTLLDRVNNPWVGAALDAELIAHVGHAPQWIRTLGQRTNVLRVRGEARELSAALEALAAVHFRGPIVLTGRGSPGDLLDRARRAGGSLGW